MKEYYQREEVKKHRKKYNKQWRKDNREKKLKQNGRYYQRYKDRMLKEAKEYYKKNYKNILRKTEEYFQNNKEKILIYRKEKYKRDLKFNLNHKIRNAIRKSLKGNKAGKHWETLVGYSVNDLMEHLKKTLSKGYCWQDYMENKLEIDHIIPKSVFNFTKSDHIDFKRCWALNNLRLLPAKENLIKSNKLVRPFQPALKLCLVD